MSLKLRDFFISLRIIKRAMKKKKLSKSYESKKKAITFAAALMRGRQGRGS
jgi:hypothetical protein